MSTGSEKWAYFVLAFCVGELISVEGFVEEIFPWLRKEAQPNSHRKGRKGPRRPPSES